MKMAPPLVEREMITMIVDTLPVFYYEKLVSYMPSSFVDSLKYPHIGVTETSCDERCDAFLWRCSSHGVAKLSYGKDGIIIDTTPRSHLGDV